MTPVQLGSQAGLEQWLTACAKVFPGNPQPVKLQSAVDLEQYAEPGMHTCIVISKFVWHARTHRLCVGSLA